MAVTLAAAFVAMPALGTSEEVVWPECYCTDKAGTRVELGELRCMDVGGRNFTARCEMSLNNPIWREVDEGCLSSMMDYDPDETTS